MLSKNKLRRLNPEQLADLASKDTISSNLQLCQQLLSDKNDALRQRKQKLVAEIASQRQQLDKIVLELKDSMKEKLRLKQRVVLDRSSRPSAHQIGKLTAIFEVTERQGIINSRKDQYINKLSEDLDSEIENCRRMLRNEADFSQLDNQFQQLSSQCHAETLILEELTRQRDHLRATYASVGGQIEQARVDYEFVEQQIRTAERQLVQLSAYLDDRSREDQQALQLLAKRASELQQQLLKGQSLVNSNRQRQKFLEIQMIEAEQRMV